jgi:hypothetical protein
LQRCLIAIGVSDGGSGDDVCPDSTPPGVRSAIVASSVDEIIDCDDNAIATPDATANDRGSDDAVKIINAAADRASVATVDAAAASSANRSDNVEKNTIATAERVTVSAVNTATERKSVAAVNVPAERTSVAELNAAVKRASVATLNDSVKRASVAAVNAAELSPVAALNTATERISFAAVNAPHATPSNASPPPQSTLPNAPPSTPSTPPPPSNPAPPTMVRKLSAPSPKHPSVNCVFTATASNASATANKNTQQ